MTSLVMHVRMARPAVAILAKATFDDTGEQRKVCVSKQPDGRAWVLTAGMVLRGIVQGCEKMATPRISKLEVSHLVVRHRRRGIDLLEEKPAHN
eukprot:4334506-Pyramimonas_sp.AAC.1